MFLIENGSGTGETVTWSGGKGVFRAGAAAWNSGTVKLQVLDPDGSTWDDVGLDTSLTANGGGIFSLEAGAQIRAYVSDATGVNATVAPLP